jgi:hypothetical protein
MCIISPVETQDLVNRSSSMSEMRSQEQGKFFGDMAKLNAEMHRLEVLKENTVQNSEESEALNPDGSNNSKRDQQNKKEQKEETQPETNTPAGRPLKLEGGDVIDLMA